MSRFKAIAARPLLAGSVIIIVATLLAYLPAIRGGFIWDDDAYVTQNDLLKDPDGLWRIWFSKHYQSQYFPLVYTTLRLQYALWGLNPLGYHVINVLVHCANALLVWVLLRRLAIPGAWLAAAIFALHPVQVETAAWITELKNTQATLLGLLSLLAWMKFADAKAKPPWRFYALSIVLYQLALFSKTTACTLPAAMVLVLWIRRQPIGLARALQIAPFFALGVIMGLVSVWWEAHLGNLQAKYDLHFSLAEKLLIATRALWFYLGKIILPVNLAFSYPRFELNPHDPAQWIWAAGCIGLAVFLWWKRELVGRGPIAAMVWFVASLSPLLGFFPLYTFYYTFVADHYQYTAALGPMALIAAGLWKLCQRLRVSPMGWQVACGGLVAVLAALTWNQASAYRDLETLWRDTLKKNPASWMAHYNLGRVLFARQDYAEAEKHYRESLRLKPDNGDAHFNFGNYLMDRRRIPEAIEHYAEAARLLPDDPEIRTNFGAALFAGRRVDEAIVQLRAAVRLHPGAFNAHVNLGIAYETKQNRNDAIHHYVEALKLQPDAAMVKARLRVLGVQTPN